MTSRLDNDTHTQHLKVAGLGPGQRVCSIGCVRACREPRSELDCYWTLPSCQTLGRTRLASIDYMRHIMYGKEERRRMDNTANPFFFAFYARRCCYASE